MISAARATLVTGVARRGRVVPHCSSSSPRPGPRGGDNGDVNNSKALSRRRDTLVYAQRRRHLHHPDLERAKFMEDVYHILGRRVLLGAKQPTSTENARYMVAVVGCPGSGKSTLAKQTSKIVNAIQQEEVARRPADGWVPLHEGPAGRLRGSQGCPRSSRRTLDIRRRGVRAKKSKK